MADGDPPPAERRPSHAAALPNRLGGRNIRILLAGMRAENQREQNLANGPSHASPKWAGGVNISANGPSGGESANPVANRRVFGHRDRTARLTLRSAHFDRSIAPAKDSSVPRLPSNVQSVN